MNVIPTRESRALCVWDTDEYVSHILISKHENLIHYLGKYERVCQQKHQ